MQFHILSFEGPDLYSRGGGLATRVEGLSDALASLGFETHLWFIGDPKLPGVEVRGDLHLHRWCQWVSQYHLSGVYAGEFDKQAEYCASLPPVLAHEVIMPHVRDGGHAVVLAEEWQTADTVLRLHRLLCHAGIRERVTILWNANNIFGFEKIAWGQLSRAAHITTVSRYMKQKMRQQGIDPLVIPNGLAANAFHPPDRGAVASLRSRFHDRMVLTKMARWDPDKQWLGTVEIVAEMKRQKWRPLLLARGGSELHGAEVLRAARERGLRVTERHSSHPGVEGLLEALREVGDADVVDLRSHVDSDARRVLFRGVAVVLANSSHEPFGLVGLEAMAAGGVVCTGCSGEDYAVPGQNALVLETGDAGEFMGLYRRLRANPEHTRRMRRAGQSTARHYAWPDVVRRVLLPRIELSRETDRRPAAGDRTVPGPGSRRRPGSPRILLNTPTHVDSGSGGLELSPRAERAHPADER